MLIPESEVYAAAAFAIGIKSVHEPEKWVHSNQPYRDTAAIASLTIGHKAQQPSKDDHQGRYIPLLVQRRT